MTIAKVMEIRSYNLTSFEQRDGEDDGHVVTGYASVFDSPTIIAECFQEQIAQGAFSKSLTTADVRALFNHNWENVLGRMKAGTLTLSEDSHGLKFEVELPDTQVARDLAVSMKRGDINQCSFGFVPTKEEWDYSNPDMPKRTIDEVELYEVSIVSLPAYEDTEATLSRDKFIEATNIEMRKNIVKKLEELKNE